MDTWLIFYSSVLLIVFFIMAIILSNGIKKTTHTVSEDQRLVIYRLGRFHRIAWPGQVWTVPGLDEVVRVIEVRERPLEITIP